MHLTLCPTKKLPWKHSFGLANNLDHNSKNNENFDKKTLTLAHSKIGLIFSEEKTVKTAMGISTKLCHSHHIFIAIKRPSLSSLEPRHYQDYHYLDFL